MGSHGRERAAGGAHTPHGDRDDFGGEPEPLEVQAES
jgi:hypothetical protein